jgi:hypothetical protein
MDYLLPIGIYLWAGLWCAWGCLSPSRRATPGAVATFIFAMLFWAVLFPPFVIIAERQRAKNKDLDALLEKITSSIAEQKGNKTDNA